MTVPRLLVLEDRALPANQLRKIIYSPSVSPPCWVHENGRDRLQQTQDEVEEVRVIMLDNLNKADERGVKLDELENRADELRVMSEKFERTTNKVKHKKMWDNMKMKVVMISVIVLVALIVLGLIIYAIVNAAGQ
ncbi:vesicle-associated membrane protein 5 [Diretmus argenteus]